MARWRTPDDVRALLRRRYAQSAGEWLAGAGAWPLHVPLGAPSEADARAHWDLFEHWLRQWQSGAGIEFEARRWPGLGVQRLPVRATFDTAEAVACALGEDDRWRIAERRCARLLSRWPALREPLSTQFGWLSTAVDADFERLLAVFDWLLAHPDSRLYPRQLPIAGIDSKWLEGGQQRVLREWLSALRAADELERRDFNALAGLRPLPDRLHVRVLDPALRTAVGGLGDVVAAMADLARLRWPALRCVFVVENLQTGLAFEDLPGSVVLIGRGYAVDGLSQLPWLRSVPLHYWGDLDTHGFAILDRVRHHLPQARSLLMDEATLLGHRDVWGEEPRPSAAERLETLTADEAQLYADLRRDRWAPRLRLEQERIDWSHAWPQLCAAAHAARDRVDAPG